MKYIFLSILFTVQLLAKAVTPASDSLFSNIEHWEESPTVHKMTAEEKKEDAVIILKQLDRHYDRIQEYTETVHKLVHVNNDLGIEKNNRVYIPTPSPDNISSLKVRVIKSDGSVVNMKRSSLKKIENLEGYGGYVIFAIEGIEVGSEIEYFYKLRKELRTCARINLQYSNTIRKQNIRIYFSSNFKYDAIVTNPDSVIFRNNRGHINIEMFNVPSFSSVDAEIFRKKLEYCFKRLDTNGPSYFNLFSLEQFQKSTIKDFTTNLPAIKVGKSVAKGDLKKIAKQDKKAYVEAMLEKLHKDYKISREGSKNPYKTKIITRKEFTIAVSTALKKMKIPHQIYVIGDRYDNEMSSNLFTYFNIDDFIIYLNKEELFFDPTCTGCGIQRLPSEYIDAKVTLVFSRRTTGPDFNTHGSYKKNRTPMVTAEYSTQTTNYLVNLEGENGATFDFKQIRTGYYASGPNSYYKYYNGTGEKFEEYVKEEIEYYGDNPKASNAELVKVSNDEVVFTANIVDDQIVQNAGENLIFNLGKIIGKQSEMYDSIPHNFPLLKRNPQTYVYEIKIDIPEGCEVTSSNNINLHEIATDGADTLCEWTSSYKVENNQIVVNIKEYYKYIQYDVKNIPAYRRVINAAADFNKGVIIFKKKL